MKKWLKSLLVFMMIISCVTLPVYAEDTITIIEDSDTTESNELFKFQYSTTGGWKSGPGDGFSNKDEHYGYAGAWVQLKFSGTKVAIYGTKAPQHGTYDIYLDEQNMGSVDAYATSRVDQQLLYQSETLVDGEHTLRLQLSEDAASGIAIQIDYAQVAHGEIKPTALILSENSVVLEQGKSQQLEVSVEPNLATIDNLKWSSSDDTIVKVENGLLTAQNKNGSAEVKVESQDGSLSAICNVSVVPVVEAFSAYVGDTDIADLQTMYDEVKGKMSFSFTDTVWRKDVSMSRIALVTRDEEVHNVNISASDLKCGDATIPSSAFEIRWLKDVQANIGRGNSYAPVELFPDVIHQGGSIDIAAKTVQSAWVNIHIPEDAQAGTYQGTLTITADELETPYIFQYEIEVLDLVQPSMQDVNSQIQIWQHPFSVAGYYGLSESEYFSDTHFAYLEAQTREQAAMGSRDVVANIVEEAWNHQSYYPDPSMVKWTKKSDGTWEFDYTWYDAWVNFNIECGMLDPENKIGAIKCYSIVPWNNQVAYYDESKQTTVKQSYTPGSSAWIDIWTPFLNDFMKHSEEKGWLDITYIAMDERSLDQLTPAVALLESIQNEDGDQFKIFSAFNYNGSEDYSFTDRIDDISIAIGNVSHTSDTMRKLCDHRKALGLTTTIYTCTGHYPSNYTISDPIDTNYVVWYTMAHHADGFMRWAWDNWVSDPLTNVTYKYWEPGDGWFIYPTEKNISSDTYFYSTPRYEMLKQGLRDTSKAKYLMGLSDALYQEVETLVESMARGSQGNNGYGSATYANETSRQTTINEANRMREGILAISKDYLENGTTNINKQALRTMINTAQSAYDNETKYTSETYEPFKEAFENAQSILNSDDVTQDEVDDALTTLQTTYNALEELTIPLLDENKLINKDAQSSVTIIDYSSQCIKGGNPNEDAEASYVLDYDTTSYWHSDFRNSIGMPQHLTFDLGENYVLSDITFLPRQIGTNGDIFKVKVYVGMSEDELEDVGEFSFEHGSKTLNNRSEFTRIRLNEATLARYVKVEIVEAGGDQLNTYTSCAEMRFYGTKITANPDVNVTVLQNVINNYKVVDGEKYYAVDYQNFMKRLEEAQALVYSAQSQEEVDDMIDALDAAFYSLRSNAKGLLPELQRNLDEFSTFTNDDHRFKDEVWNLIQSKILQLNDIISNPQNYIHNEVSDFYMELNNLYERLKRFDRIGVLYIKVLEEKANHSLVPESLAEINDLSEIADRLLVDIYSDIDEVGQLESSFIRCVSRIRYLPVIVSPTLKQIDYKTLRLTALIKDTKDVSTIYVKRIEEDGTENIVQSLQYDYLTNPDVEIEYEANVKTGKTYSYKIEVNFHEYNRESLSSEVLRNATQLEGRVKLAIEKVGNTRFKLSWSAIEGATRYIIYRKRNSDSYKKVLTLGKDDFAYTTSSMAAGTYQFIVKAARYDSKERVMTQSSNSVTGKSEFTKPKLSVSTTTNQAKLSWNEVEGVKYYEVYRSTSRNGKYVPVVTTTKTTYTNKGLKSGKTYYFKVRGYKAYQDILVYGPSSDIKSVKVK